MSRPDHTVYLGKPAVVERHCSSVTFQHLGDTITATSADTNLPTRLDDVVSPNVYAYPNESIVAEKAEAVGVLEGCRTAA
jgi:hypothetical protein